MTARRALGLSAQFALAALPFDRNTSDCPPRRSLIAVLLAVVFLSNVTIAFARVEYSFAPAPQYEHRKLFAIWKPIVDELTRRTNLEFALVIPFSIPEHERAFFRGDYDFVYINPGHFVRAMGRLDYVPLVSDVAALRGIVVVAKNSSIKNAEELQEKLMAIPSRNAFGASLAIQSQLLSKYGVKVRVISVNTHTSVYLHVTNNLVDAGGGVEKTLEAQPISIRDKLRIVYRTCDLPSHPVAAHPRVPREVREKVRAAFIEMAQTPEGAALLAKVPLSGVRPVTMDDYRNVEKFDAFWVESSE